MDDAKLAGIEARASETVVRCSVCDAPARWTEGESLYCCDFCDGCKGSSGFLLEPSASAELDALDLIAEVRRLRAEAEAREEVTALRARVEALEESAAMACLDPRAGCDCAGCLYARAKGGEHE